MGLGGMGWDTELVLLLRCTYTNSMELGMVDARKLEGGRILVVHGKNLYH